MSSKPVIIELSQERAEFFVLCEREREYIYKCLKAKPNLLTLFEDGVIDMKNGSAVIDVDSGGNFQNTKIILNFHHGK